MFFLINYYFSQSRTDKQNVALVVQSGAAARRGADKGEYLYTISRPNTGLQLTQESLSEIKKRFRKITPQKAEPIWKDLFNSSKTNCSHIYWFVDILRQFEKNCLLTAFSLGMVIVVQRIWESIVSLVCGRGRTTFYPDRYLLYV